LKSDDVLKSSNNVNDTFFEHIGFQEIVRGDYLIDLITEFDSRAKFTQQGKHKTYHLSHDTKINHMEVVDAGKISCLFNDEVAFHCTNEGVKYIMWKVFNNNKNYMVIDSTDQEAVCCTFDIGTSFQELLNNHYDHIPKDSVFMFHPSME
jgi:hypothetical protein